MESALRAHGDDVVAHYYDGAPHGLAQVDGIRRDLQVRIALFACVTIGCPSPAPATAGVAPTGP